jgi:hypothetical protein
MHDCSQPASIFSIRIGADFVIRIVIVVRRNTQETRKCTEHTAKMTRR